MKKKKKLKIKVEKELLFQLDLLFLEMQGFYSSNYLIFVERKAWLDVYSSIFEKIDYVSNL